MELFLMLLLPLIHFLLNRIEWKINQWLYIDIYIGRNNFYNFYKRYKITLDNMSKLEKKL